MNRRIVVLVAVVVSLWLGYRALVSGAESIAEHQAPSSELAAEL